MKNNNYFPLKSIVVTNQDKLEFLQGIDFPIDPAILPVVEAINKTSIFLTDSSCEGQNGNPYSKHFKYAYVGIGVLYNQISWLEKFAHQIKSTLGEAVDCSLNFSTVSYSVDDDHPNVEVPVFRTFLRVDIYERETFSQVIHFIQKFSEDMPDIKQFIDDSIFQNAEYRVSATVQQNVDGLIAAHIKEDLDDTQLEKCKEEIRALGGEIDDDSIVKISFSDKNRQVEELFRLLTATMKGNMKGFCQINLDDDKNFFNNIRIDLFDDFLLPVISAILQRFFNSPDGKIAEV
ncbi:hypothetical protein [Paenibacillus sp. V4I5]|uniref:hypothetical protein n=1 Tax=Paenibacillus sp. V4I5 TaxID=3042306 RepID=UPI00278CBBEF|nr:hypothetical protein [Paenibacillus sp. V4I5]MDQ0913828.1 hypothetical protein [Paenibacillus sp. V4I5]